MGSTSESIYGWKLKQLINVGVHYTTVSCSSISLTLYKLTTWGDCGGGGGGGGGLLLSDDETDHIMMATFGPA